jgi:hypothetical protein
MNTRKLIYIATIAGLALTASCVDNTDSNIEDGENDTIAADGKADGLSSGNDLEALAVLGLLRDATFEELDVDARLSSRAARNIIEHRQGPDRVDGTSDDDLIDTLTELDAIPYVGPAVFAQLVEYAYELEAVPSSDPFDDTYCRWDPPLAADQFRSWFADGALTAVPPLLGADVDFRARACNSFSGCPDWQTTGSNTAFRFIDPYKTGTPDISLNNYRDAVIGSARYQAGRYFALTTHTKHYPDSPGLELKADCSLAPDTANPALLVPGTCAITKQGYPIELVSDAPRGTVRPVETHIGAHCARIAFHETPGSSEVDFVWTARY